MTNERSTTWITHREAAALMAAHGFRVNEKRLRERDKAGDYRHYPELERRREGRTITMDRRQVEEWIADRAEAARCKTRKKEIQASMFTHAFAEVKEVLAHTGARNTLRALERLGY